ncbi:MAG: radical SAM protein [Eubacteriales bacterium]|nr:radical SAM protein [Eubacteriales bacterium]
MKPLMNQGIQIFNRSMTDWLINNKKYLFRRPAYFKDFAKISANLKKQAKIRNAYAKNEDLIVPPILILSVTNDCNLSCKGCYACGQQRDKSGELDIAEIGRIVDEAIALGVAVIMIAGGEPLLKKGILDIPEKHPDTLFVMFTNGLLLRSAIIKKLDTLKNLVPIISIEGGRETTDARRGDGMFNAVTSVMDSLDKEGRLFGASVTLTNENFDEVVMSSYLEQLESYGCGVVFLIEFVPSEGDFSLCLTDAQKQHLRKIEDSLAAKHRMLVISLPGDEEKYGGCLASGRGFLHISSTGSLEACPFAPYSDTTVSGKPLKEALGSRLLLKIRDNHHMLKESRGGCALIENKEWVKTLTEH